MKRTREENRMTFLTSAIADIFSARLLSRALPMLFALCSGSLNAAPSHIWFNGEVQTSNPEAPTAQAFAIEDGRFVAVGSNDIVLALADKTTKVQDLKGKAVLPGIIDNHFHLSSWLFFGEGVNMMDTEDRAVWFERIRERAENTPKGDIILGAGWRPGVSAKLPTAAQLDSITREHPVVLIDSDHHSIWVNSNVLERFNITADTPNPEGGEIVKDPVTGQPTGILKEAAGHELIAFAIGSLSKEKKDEVWLHAMANANRMGITGMHNIGAAPEAEELISLAERKQFPLRMWFGAFTSVDSVDHDLQMQQDIMQRANVANYQGPRMEFGYLKVFADGVVSTHTAALEEQYQDKHGHFGAMVTPVSDLQTIITKANSANVPVAVHAIGDAAIKATLDAFEASPKRPALPNRIEHAELTTAQDIKRFAPLNVVASMQPYHAISGSKYYEARVGKARHNRAWAWKDYLNSGALLTFGSDWPTDEGSPLVILEVAVTQQDENGVIQGNPEHTVSFEQALYAMTQATANISGWGDQLGSISVGKWADFVVLDKSLPEPVDHRLLELQVESTYIAGDNVYQKAAQ